MAGSDLFMGCWSGVGRVNFDLLPAMELILIDIGGLSIEMGVREGLKGRSIPADVENLGCVITYV